jgi:DNA (cytosine-5)-methyltransferase 1
LSVYYNEIDPYAAQWLRNLITAGELPAGDVDERSIEDVRPEDVRGYAQCHWFAGIGGWGVALRLARWDDAEPVWTGSCPCQPYSVAGDEQGATDARNLWPEWFRLIRECRPVVVFGEQVDRAVGHGWLDAVSTDLEAEGYAIGASVLGAHSVGAPHGRQRLYFVGRSGRSHSNGRASDWRDLGLPVGRIGSQADCEALPDAPRTVWAAEPRPSTVADGVLYRVEQCRAYGNAIVPRVAAEFVSAYMEVACTTP